VQAGGQLLQFADVSRELVCDRCEPGNAANAPQAVLDPVEPGELRWGEPVVGAGIDRGVEILERLCDRFDPLVVRRALA